MDSQIAFKGWLLDVSTYSEGVILWVKTEEERKVIRIFQEFSPEFFAVPKDDVGNDFKKRMQYILTQNQNVKKVRICEKYVKLEDHEKLRVLGVTVDKPSLFKKTIKEVDEIGLFTLYNTDLPITQMYFYVNDLFPMSFCQFEIKVEKSNGKKANTLRLISIDLQDDNEKLFYDLPPLRAVWLDVKIQYQGIKPYYNDPISYAEVSIVENDEDNVPRADGYKKRRIRIDKTDEAEILRSISKVIERLNPDIILTHNGDEFLFPYLVARASENRVARGLIPLSR